MNIKPQYVVDDQNQKIAVQLDVDTFRRIEEVLENYALYQIMQKDEDDPILTFEEAKAYYQKLDKE